MNNFKLDEPLEEYLQNANIAFENGRYEVALRWYQRVLAQDASNLEALSRAGMICTALERYNQALPYFETARQVDPTNGDNSFNLANAYFFCEDYAKAFELYLQAEELGCSEDVLPRLYFQLGALNVVHGNFKAALVYYQRAEEADPSGMMAMNAELIVERMKLHMLAQNFPQAEKCAVKLIAIEPTEYRYYANYFSLLMARREFERAEKILNQAEKFADIPEEAQYTIVTYHCAVYLGQAEQNSELAETYYRRAISVLLDALDAPNLKQADRTELILTLAEVLAKQERYDRAIQWLKTELLEPIPQQQEFYQPAVVAELSEYELAKQFYDDIERMEERINCGELPDDLGEESEEYELGSLLTADERQSIIEKGEEVERDTESVNAEADSGLERPEAVSLSAEQQDRATFILITCYAGKDEFEPIIKLAAQLKHSENTYYSYYGRYTECLACRKFGASNTEQCYTRAIAYFRHRMLENSHDTIAAIFRARLYAESGKLEYAREIAEMLPDEDRETVMTYIQECEAKGNQQ